MQVPLGGRERAVARDLPQHVDRDADVGHPGEAGVPQVVPPQVAVALIEDPDTRVITAFVEGLREGGELRRCSCGIRAEQLPTTVERLVDAIGGPVPHDARSSACPAANRVVCTAETMVRRT